MNCSCNNPDCNFNACSFTSTAPEKRFSQICGCDLPIVIRGECPEDKIVNMLGAGDNIWTQIFVPEVLLIPVQKPDIEQLHSVTAALEIISQRVVKTPVLVIEDAEIPIENEEGLITTGRKLVVEGILRQKIVYTAANPEQSVHSAHFDVPFSAFMILPAGTPLYTRYKIESCIEDIYISNCTDRQVFKNVTLFIKATALS
ncbi:MAG: DUF3794 domain-containing protein [Syntrophomonas sp.]|nr:DUF3794 domain-containing protein [Syntrophomonas sp.]